MRDFSLGLSLLESRPKGVPPLPFCFVFKSSQFQETKLLVWILFWLVQQTAKACSRSSGERGRRVCYGGVGNSCFALWQAVFTDFLLFSVTSCRGSTERSPQDTDPDVPSSISAVTTETGSDEVFIISAGPGASGLSFTTYRIQVGMLFGISRKPQDVPLGQRLSYLSISAYCPLCKKVSDWARRF